MLFIMDTGRIYERIKKTRNQHLINNCYDMNVVDRANCMWSDEDDFMFSYDDHGINRLVFFVRTWEKLNKLLGFINRETYFLEFMTRNRNEYIPNDAIPRAAMMRLANPDCRSVLAPESAVLQYKDSALVEDAVKEDIEEINAILWDTFHTEISHLLSNEELMEKIAQGQLIIHRNNGNCIDALLQVDVMPKKFYINQVVNRTDRHVIHAMLLNRLERYINAGGKYLYAWVEDSNIASIKFHEKYGMKHDGMWSMIYSIER